MRTILVALFAALALTACTKHNDKAAEKAARDRDERIMMQKLLNAAAERPDADVETDAGVSAAPSGGASAAR